MTAISRADIIRMAEEADAFADAMDYAGKNYNTLRDEYFASLVALAVYEACVKECNQIRFSGYFPPEDGNAPYYYNEAAESCADAIKELAKNNFKFDSEE